MSAVEGHSAQLSQSMYAAATNLGQTVKHAQSMVAIAQPARGGTAEVSSRVQIFLAELKQRSRIA